MTKNMSNAARAVDLSGIPFVDPRGLGAERIIPSLMFYVKGEWQNWIPCGEALIEIKATPYEGCYFGDHPEQSTDQCFEILDFLAQHALTAKSRSQFSGLWSDFLNLAASLAKLGLFYTSDRKGMDNRRFAQTELEYVIMVCRSMFDLLQEIVVQICNRSQLADGKRPRSVKESFHDMVERGGVARTAEEISERTGLPIQFGAWYAAEEPFFMRLWKLRNRMAHGGNDSIKYLFCTERGFALRRDEPLWGDLHSWSSGCEQKNNIVPLRPLIADIILNTFKACDGFTSLMKKRVVTPFPACPRLRLYSRGRHDIELSRLTEVRDKDLWCDEIYPLAPKHSWFARAWNWVAEEWKNAGGA